MLETIKRCISSRYEPFDEFYSNYILSVQDSAIDNEMSHVQLNASSDSCIKSISKHINKMHKDIQDIGRS